jgi:DNA-binding MarR family transcriptional regulator
MGIIKTIQIAARNNKTYRVGLLQDKAYRILKQTITKALSPYEITSVHWAFLGLLSDNSDGMRPNDAAKELGVEAPFVTILFKELEKRNFVESQPDTSDSRAKILCLTKEGRSFVEKTETYLRKEINHITQNVSAKDLLGYLTVLDGIVKNNKQ